MKTLKSLLLSFFVVSQLTAQTNVGRDSLVPGGSIIVSAKDTLLPLRDTITLRTDTVAPGPDTTVVPTDSAALRPDTIALARSAAYQKDFDKADRLLTEYTVNHPDVDALSLHALVLYWMKSHDRSMNVYEKTLDLFPQPSSLHLDYARLLYNSGKLSKARELLRTYARYDSSNVEAVIMTAYIDLWNGRVGSAEKKATGLLQKFPGNEAAKDIITQAGFYTIPYIKTGVEILSDDQPLKGHSFFAEAGVYKSWLFAPTAQVAFYNFRDGDSAFHSNWTQVANTIQLGLKTKVKLQGGVFQQNGNSSAFTGSIEVSQKVARHFLLQAAQEKRPYQYAVGSIKTIVMEDVSALSLSYNRNDKWLGKAAYELFQYKDDNKIHTAYLWILAPVVSTPWFSLSGGYAFRYADAVKNNFVSKKSVSALLASSSYADLAGVYSPYFTPENQKVHAALALVKIIPSKKLEFSSRVGIGLLGKADNPYLFLDKSGNHYDFRKGYVGVDFMQASWVNELRVMASSDLSVTANYSYDKLLYYKGHKGSIALKYHFLK